ncbi:MAG: occludin/ELL family protein [Prochlorococcus sp. TMED223]|nr:MAG: occludin/ELL family protein [Prochlorococcus sp. TMED223]
MGWCVKDSLPSLRVVVFFAVMAWVSFHKLRMLGLALVTPLAVTGWGGGLAWARPVVCTTTLEAPDPSEMPIFTNRGLSESSMGPVEVTQCGPLESTGALIERRFYSWTAPYARGVDVLHQLTDMLGIAVAGHEGNRLMGFGFPDQTIIWDGSAVQNTYQVLLEEQSPSLPWRTVDISSGFDNSLAGDVPSEIVMVEDGPEMNVAPEAFTPIRGMW